MTELEATLGPTLLSLQVSLRGAFTTVAVMIERLKSG